MKNLNVRVSLSGKWVSVFGGLFGSAVHKRAKQASLSFKLNSKHALNEPAHSVKSGPAF